MKKYRAPVLVILLIMIGVLITPFNMIAPVKDKTVIIFAPITSTFLRVGRGIRTFKDTIIAIGDIRKENEYLKKKNLSLETQNIKLAELEYENELLRKGLKFNKSSKFQLVAAQIIAKGISGYSDTIIINKGKTDGIKEKAVVLSDGFLIGRVKQVREQSADIMLITSNNSKIPAYLQNSRATGLVAGGLQGLRMENISLEIDIKEEERVLTSDLGGLLPQGIPIGFVKAIESSESDMTQLAGLISPINFNKLELVFIIK